MTAILLALGIVFGLAVLISFLLLERAGRGTVVIAIILGLVVSDSALYWSPNEVPFGLFHPRVGSLNFRLVDVVIPMALVARVATRGLPRRFGVAGFLWSVMLAWLGAEAILGLYYGNDRTLVGFEAKLGIYLSCMLLTAGTPIR